MKKINKIYYALILIVTLTVFGVLCYYCYTSKVYIDINGEKIELNILDNKAIDLDTFNSNDDVIITKLNGIGNVIIDGNKLKNGDSINIGKIKIGRDNKIGLVVKKLFIKHTFEINTLSSTFPKYSSYGESNYEGDYYLTTFSMNYTGDHYIFILNKQGKITYYKKTNMVSFDFTAHKNKKGEIRYMYLEGKKPNFEGATSIVGCELVVLDAKYNEIDRIKYLNKDGTYSLLDNHTYMYIDDEHYILTSYTLRKIEDKNVEVLDCLIHEIKDGKVIWEFNSGDYPELYDCSTVEGKDYIHINSIDLDKDDGNIICSFRNIDALIKLDRKTGQIMWMLGGKKDEFNLSNEEKFSKQHSWISIGNNTYFVYDNGNENRRTRIVKFVLDEKNKKVIEYKEYDTNIYAVMMGSIRIIDLDKQVNLICYGGKITKTNTNFRNIYLVEEINFATNKLEFGFTFLDGHQIYNANKIDIN